MKKKVISALLATSLIVVSASAGAFAASNLESIKAYLNLGVKFTVGGKNWTPTDSNGKKIYPITYNNTTYLPIRSAGDALGVDIVWDSPNNTIRLGEGSSSGSGSNSGSNSGSGNTTSAGSAGFAQDNPAPLNSVVSFQKDEYDYSYTADLHVSEVLRGEAALKKISAANSFNPVPAAGSEFILFKVNFKLTGITGANEHYLSEYDFDLVSGDEIYEQQSIVEPEPSLGGTLTKGKSMSGWVAFLIEKGDNPVLVYDMDYYGEDGIWFKLK